MMESQSAADQPRPDSPLSSSAEPGSQSSSGMSDRLDDALVEAHERGKLRRGEELDVDISALGDAVRNGPANPTDGPDSPVGRNPEATAGPVTD